MRLRIVLGIVFALGQVAGFADCPKEDRTHRYLSLPIHYDNPKKGSFRLYYELNTDFDPAKPTLFFVYDGQQPIPAAGDPDELKSSTYRVSFNIIRMEHRGLDCSKIPVAINGREVDWLEAYRIYHSRNVVEDIERIRKAVIGDRGHFYLFGGSGGGALVLQYLAKYPKAAEKVYLERTTDDFSSNWKRQVDYFFSWLRSEGVYDEYERLMRAGGERAAQLLWLLQRVAYDYYPTEHVARNLVREIPNPDSPLWKELSAAYPPPQNMADPHVWPFVWIRIFELFPTAGKIPLLPSGTNAFELPLRALTELARKGLVPSGFINVRPWMRAVNAKVLLAAARWDHQFPYETMVEMSRSLKGSQLLVYDDTHKNLFNQVCHRRLFKVFFEWGTESQEWREGLGSGICRFWKWEASDGGR